MKHIHLAFLMVILFSLTGLQAQQNHFIYIQTENRQPFYIKLNAKLYSSSATGYLVVSKLKQGDYNLAVGFPKNEWAEQNLVCTIEQNDLGYLLKNLDDKGWGLVNLQTSKLISSVSKIKEVNAEVINKTDAFSNLLSNVVNDSTIRQAEAVKSEVKTANTEIPAGNVTGKDTAIITTTLTTQTNISTSGNGSSISNGEEAKMSDAQQQLTESNRATRSVIKRTLMNNNEGGTEMIFIDISNDTVDTITVYIPANKKEIAIAKTVDKPQEVEKPKEVEKAKEEGAKIGAETELKVKEKDKKFLEVEVPTQNNQVEAGKLATINSGESTAGTVAEKALMINSDCKNFASEDDFLKLRKKMAANDTDEEMISLAKKTLRTRCFTVEQVRNLSVLFLKDSGKYAFFDMAYPFVADSHNFSTLQSQLTEAYYISRFQVMIRH
ncbi:MAG: DUF4476 domain-containing protein [Ferruginibacter sp.]